MSVTDLRFNGLSNDRNGIKSSRDDLNGIIADVMELQDSNNRVGKMIEKKTVVMVGSQVSTNSFQTRLYANNYGL